MAPGPQHGLPGGGRHSAANAGGFDATTSRGLNLGPFPYRGLHLAPIKRRSVLRGAGGLAAAIAALEVLERIAWVPEREAAAADAAKLPDVQFDLDRFIAPPIVVEGVPVRFGPVHTVFATARLDEAPTAADQEALTDALAQIEESYDFAPDGVFTHVAYGRPYFRRLPAEIVAENIPRLLDDEKRFVLEAARVAPTDVNGANKGIKKERFNVPVRLEGNDLLFTFRSDEPGNIRDVLRWLRGSNRLRGKNVASPRLGCGLEFTSSRSMFAQIGLPRRLADRFGLVFAKMVNPQSPMWMGFVDQQVSASAPAPFVTFQGADGFSLTTAENGDYFDNGAIQHLSHVILDLQQFYDVDDEGVPQDDASFLERVQYMFRSTPPPSLGNDDQITDGGGPAFLENDFQGTGDAEKGARGIGTPENERRIGHVAALQRSSRTADGKPIHLRIDGPGFDAFDVPDGSRQPKLQFSAFFPTSRAFARMRRDLAAQDLEKKFDVDPDENGLERFSTATRRQNFLIPPRRNRAFPLVELT